MNKIVCVNAATNQAYWQLPVTVENALGAALAPGWELLVARGPGELPKALRAARVALGWPFPAVMARGAAELSWVHFFTRGVPESWDAIGGVRVTTTPPARSVAEHALFLAMCALRGATTTSFQKWEPDAFLQPRAIDTLSAVVFGHGAVGRPLAKLLVPLFSEVTVVARHAPDALPAGARFASVGAWERVAPSADVLFLALPKTVETRRLLGPAFFSALKDTAIVVNVASGALVDEGDVLAFLARSPLRRYASDVAHPEPYPDGGALYASRQALLTPHVGARREDAWSVIAARALEVLPEAMRAVDAGA
jgi:phosphoglycerate dehydrogenase-like enzyme